MVILSIMVDKPRTTTKETIDKETEKTVRNELKEEEKENDRLCHPNVEILMPQDLVSGNDDK